MVLHSSFYCYSSCVNIFLHLLLRNAYVKSMMSVIIFYSDISSVLACCMHEFLWFSKSKCASLDNLTDSRTVNFILFMLSKVTVALLQQLFFTFILSRVSIYTVSCLCYFWKLLEGYIKIDSLTKYCSCF